MSTASTAGTFRSKCKACPDGIYTGQATVWGRGQYLGLLHQPCAVRVGAVSMPAADDGRHAPIPEPKQVEVRSYGALLTERQQVMVRLLAAGRSTADIAAAAQVTTQTVLNTLRNARVRLGTDDNAALIAEAQRRGLIPRA